MFDLLKFTVGDTLHVTEGIPNAIRAVREEQSRRAARNVVNQRTQIIARNKAKSVIKRAVEHSIAMAEADAMAKRQRSEDLQNAILNVLGRAIARSYGGMFSKLAEHARGESRGDALTEAQERELAEQRKKTLRAFAEKIVLETRRAADDEAQAGGTDADQSFKVAEIGEKLLDEHADNIAETESQTAYGAAQFKALVDAGYKKAVWVTVGDDRVRESHTECEEAGAIKLGDPFPNGLLYPGDPTGPLEEIANCFPEDTIVEYPGLRSAMKRWHDGYVIEVSFAGGNKLTATPNHPILRSDGTWIPIGELNKGDYCVGGSFSRQDTRKPHVNSAPTKIGEIYSACKLAASSKRIAIRPPDFHGDATNGHVEIVTIKRSLDINFEAASEEEIKQLGFTIAAQAAFMLGTCQCLPMIRFRTGNKFDNGFSPFSVGGSGVTPALIGSAISGKDSVSFCPCALSYSAFAQSGGNHRAADVECNGQGVYSFPSMIAIDDGINGKNMPPFSASRETAFRNGAQSYPGLNEGTFQNDFVSSEKRSQSAQRLPSKVTLNKVINVNRVRFHGYVYNLDTGAGYYIANGIINRNCRCILIGIGTPVIKSSYGANWDDALKHPRDEHGRWKDSFWRAPLPQYKSKLSLPIRDAIHEMKGRMSRPVAGAIIVNDHGEVLMAHSSWGGQGWFFPKGGVDETEDYEQAARREAREEVNVEANGPIGSGVPIKDREIYSDSLGFGSPRKDTRGKDPRISKGAADVLSVAAAIAGIKIQDLNAERGDVFDDLASRVFVTWESEPIYHFFSANGRPGSKSDEVSEIRWVKPEEARKLPRLHGHARELLFSSGFDEAVAHIAANAAPVKGAEFKEPEHPRDAVGKFAKKTMLEAIAHFQALQTGALKRGPESAAMLLKSRKAFKALPVAHQAAFGALGKQVMEEAHKAGYEYVGGGVVTDLHAKKPAKSPAFLTKPPKPSKTGVQGPTTGTIPGDSSPATASGVAIAAKRCQMAADALKAGTEAADAVLGVIDSGDPAKMALIQALTFGDGAHRALAEFKDTPTRDLQCLSAIEVKGTPIPGQANCYMAIRKLTMGSTSVTGDFRHELGHALHGLLMLNPTLNAHIHELHKEAMAKVKSNPAGLKVKLTHEFYETTYGVIGRRALDDEKENVAEHYRGYHKAVYRTRTGEDLTALKTYRERFPGWARLWDAWYSWQGGAA